MFKKLFKRYNRRVEEQSKIDDVLKELNGGKVTGDWIAVPNNHALTLVDFNGKAANFRPDAGIPLKVFVNVKTGEIKTYDARAFYSEISNG